MPRRSMKNQQADDWNLADLVLNPNESEKELSRRAEKLIKLLTAFPERGTTARALAFLQEEEAYLLVLKRITLFYEMRLSVNTEDDEARARLARIDQLARRVSRERDRFIDWLRSAESAAIKPILTSKYQTIIEQILKHRKHILPLQVEQALSITSRASEPDILDALQASQTAEFLGRKEPLSRIRAYVHHPDPPIREAAYTTLLTTTAETIPTLRVLFTEHVMRMHAARVRLRAYTTVREPVLIDEGIPESAYQALIKSIRSAFPLFSKAARIKYVLLSQKKPYAYSRFHHYAQHPSLHEQSYDFPTAYAIVKRILSQIPEWQRLAENVLTRRHASIYPKQGKYHGAFCADNPRGIPYMLLNHTGSIQDVPTLAHELGHCIHDQLIAQDIPLQERHPRLSIAELASTTLEGLVLHQLQKQAHGEHKLALLLLEVDEWQATVLRQAIFSMMEDLAYTRIPKGEPISSLSKAYKRLLQQAYPGMQDLDAFADEWLTIPHLYHHPYYVFTYAWTFLLSRIIISRFAQKRMRDAFTRILQQGGRIAGITALRDITGMPPEEAFQAALHQLDLLIQQITREAERLGYTIKSV